MKQININKLQYIYNNNTISMPKIQIDYSKTIIYKICSKDLTIKDCYDGSTNDFDRRKGQHKSACCNENDKDHILPVYQFIRSHGGWANWSMILVEFYNTCSNKLEKLARERYYVEFLNATLNCQIPGRTQKEYHAVHKEHFKEYYKEYHKQYDVKRLETKISCPCGGCYDLIHKARHFRTEKHQNYIIKIQEILLKHDKIMTNIDNIINETSKFIINSENFIKRLHI